MSRFADLEEFIELMENQLNVQKVIKIDIKTYFIFLVFRVRPDSLNMYKSISQKQRDALKSQLNPCIYKKR